MKALSRIAYAGLGIVLGLCAAAYLTGCAKVEAQSSQPQDTLTWTMPTQYTDGSALAPADLAKTTVVWGTTPGGPYPNTQDVAAPATTVMLTRSGTGTRCYKVNVTTVAAKGSVPGSFSNEACKTTFAAPNAPTGLAAQ